MIPIVSVRLENEQDIVIARQRARHIAELAGFNGQDQTRIATAVSEVGRNAQMYARGGRAEFAIDDTDDRQWLHIIVSDTGPGIRDLIPILHGRYRSTTGMGVGLQGARRLMDDFDVQSSAAGTLVTLRKRIPRRARAITPADVAAFAAELAKDAPREAWDEVLSQNRELLAALNDLHAHQTELAQLNRELEDTNRGVVALYADLDEKAEHLRRANQLKSTFLSHMSHEFRTPLNSIMALARILLGRMDGPLNPEQEKQVEYIFRAAQELTDMVNDLLDLAKVEAGKIELHPSEWNLETLFGTLRGMMRPLVANVPVQLTIEEPQGIPPLFTDEAKVTQILRNFLSNAMKFTERGEIRVTSSYDELSGRVRVAVSDTGIGIAPEDQRRIFEQFVQVDSAQQRRVKGTGLGLPLSNKFAELLGGAIEVSSHPGEGTTFTLTIPARLDTLAGDQPPGFRPARRAPGAKPLILVIDDEETARYLVGKQLGALEVEILEARSGSEGLAFAKEHRPDAIVLDLIMPGMSGYDVAERLKADARTREIPVIVHSSKSVSAADRDQLACAAVVGKSSRGELADRVAELLQIYSR